MADYSRYADEELGALLRQGDHAAFNEIHNRHFEALFASAYNVLRDEDVCMDIVQEVLIWFWEHRGQHTIRSIKGYLLMGVKYQVANYIRSTKVRENFKLAHLKDDNSFIEDTVELKELQALIRDFTEQLPARCREVFQLSREQHLSNKEIAQKLGISEKTVSVQIMRALSKLRTDLGKMYFWINFFL